MAWQRAKVAIPKRFGPTERMAIAQEVIDFIVQRSKSGKAINGSRFPAYSPGYRNSLDFKIAGKGSKVDLTLSGEMLDSIQLLSDKSGEITIGFDKSDTKLNGKAEGNQLGTYGHNTPLKGRARPFLGISADDLKKITAKYPRAKDESIARAQEELGAAKAAGDLVTGIDFNLDEEG